MEGGRKQATEEKSVKGKRMKQTIDNNASGSNLNLGDEPPNEEAAAFYNLLRVANGPLWEGAQPARSTQLSAVTALLDFKEEFKVTDYCFDRFMYVLHTSLPSGNILPKNYKESLEVVARSMGKGAGGSSHRSGKDSANK